MAGRTKRRGDAAEPIAVEAKQRNRLTRCGAAGAADVAIGVPGNPVARLGDGDGGNGFHEPLRTATLRYAVACARGERVRDDAALRDGLRAAIPAAPRRAGRSLAEVAQYAADAELDRLIAGAFAWVAWQKRGAAAPADSDQARVQESQVDRCDGGHQHMDGQLLGEPGLQLVQRVMKHLLTTALGAVCLAGNAWAVPPARPMVVELFTSQACSDCPPADALLRRLQATDPGILALDLHVTYFNGPGWTDPFSSEMATDRQYWYASLRHADQVSHLRLWLMVRLSRSGLDGRLFCARSLWRGPPLRTR